MPCDCAPVGSSRTEPEMCQGVQSKQTDIADLKLPWAKLYGSWFVMHEQQCLDGLYTCVSVIVCILFPLQISGIWAYIEARAASHQAHKHELIHQCSGTGCRAVRPIKQIQHTRVVKHARHLGLIWQLPCVPDQIFKVMWEMLGNFFERFLLYTGLSWAVQQFCIQLYQT